MDLLVTAVAFLIIFSAIILIHEFGHFYVARKSGIKVEEFGIGLPPRIWGKKIKGTIYSINWIPFGGFVKLLGEDALDSEMLKKKDSFASKPLRKRMAVVCAGVFMNFFLAVFLLTIGFTAGIEPLIVNSQDVFNAIDNNVIEISNDIRIKEVIVNSPAFNAGLLNEDKIITLNGKSVNDVAQLDILKQTYSKNDINIGILRQNESLNIKIPGNTAEDSKAIDLGVKLYDAIYLPRVIVRNVMPGSESDLAGLKSGDVVIKINNKPVYSVSDYQNIINKENLINYEVIRNNENLNFNVAFQESQRVIITNVELEAPAYKAGFQVGDLILEINGSKIFAPEDAINMTKQNINKELLYKIDRDSQILELKVAPSENGRIGVGLLSMLSYKNNQLSVYNSENIASVIKVHDVKYPFFSAIQQAFNETGRLSILTVDMFGNLVKSVVSQFAIPEGVAGPIGIARLTHVFAQQGLLALLRFTALLSLSLAVINILPFPALDGGRLLFLLVEAIRGKRVSPKWETAIHTIGFLLLIGLIFLVSFSDILNIFS